MEKLIQKKQKRTKMGSLVKHFSITIKEKDNINLGRKMMQGN